MHIDNIDTIAIEPENFYPLLSCIIILLWANFFVCVLCNDYIIEPMVIFTAWEKY